MSANDAKIPSVSLMFAIILFGPHSNRLGTVRIRLDAVSRFRCVRSLHTTTRIGKGHHKSCVFAHRHLGTGRRETIQCVETVQGGRIANARETCGRRPAFVVAPKIVYLYWKISLRKNIRVKCEYFVKCLLLIWGIYFR